MNSVIRLLSHQTALIGYGSLLSLPSLERTLGRTYTGPFVPCTVRGWRRTWDAAIPNQTFYEDRPEGRLIPEFILYLNVRRDAATNVNGVIFVVDPDELAAYDRRESVYDRVDVTAELDVNVEGGRAYIYVCRPKHRLSGVQSPQHAAVRASYVRIVESGLSHFDSAFREQYNKSTDPVPPHLIIEDAMA